MGSTRSLTSSTGILIPNSHISYFPYGLLRSGLNSNNLPSRQYTGQINDDATGLYFYNARYYNPRTATFITADQAEGPNRYAYVDGNPILRSDPTGNYIFEGGTCTRTACNDPTASYEYSEGWPFDQPRLTRLLSPQAAADYFGVAQAMRVPFAMLVTSTKSQSFWGGVAEGLATDPVGLSSAGMGIASAGLGILGSINSGPGAYTLELIRAGKVPVREGPTKPGNGAEMKYWLPEAVVKDGYLHRGVVFHEVWTHYWRQFKGIARGNKGVFAKMYAGNPAYFEALAHEQTYKFLISHGGSQEEIAHELYYQGKQYDLWVNGGSRAPRYEDYATWWDKILDRFR